MKPGLPLGSWCSTKYFCVRPTVSQSGNIGGSLIRFWFFFFKQPFRMMYLILMRTLKLAFRLFQIARSGSQVPAPFAICKISIWEAVMKWPTRSLHFLAQNWLWFQTKTYFIVDMAPSLRNIRLHCNIFGKFKMSHLRLFTILLAK